MKGASQVGGLPGLWSLGLPAAGGVDQEGISGGDFVGLARLQPPLLVTDGGIGMRCR